MISSEVAHIYSRVLFHLSATDALLEERARVLNSLAEMFKKDPKIHHFISAPDVGKQNKEQIFKDILKNYDDGVMISFLTTLIDRGRFEYIPQIAREFNRKVEEKLKVLEGQLMTPIALESGLLDDLKKTLEKVYGKKVGIKEVISPALIGGAVLMIDNKLIDFSLKGKLSRLKNHLLSKKI